MPSTLPFGLSVVAVVFGLWIAYRFRGRAHDPKRSLIGWACLALVGVAIWAVGTVIAG